MVIWATSMDLRHVDLTINITCEIMSRKPSLEFSQFCKVIIPSPWFKKSCEHDSVYRSR